MLAELTAVLERLGCARLHHASRHPHRPACAAMVLSAGLLVYAGCAVAQPKATDNTTTIQIVQPNGSSQAGREVTVSVTVNGLGERHVWILARRVDFAPQWWPEQEAQFDSVARQWRGIASIGEARDIGYRFDVGVVVVDAIGHAYLSTALQKARREKDYRPLDLPPRSPSPTVVTVLKNAH